MSGFMLLCAVLALLGRGWLALAAQGVALAVVLAVPGLAGNHDATLAALLALGGQGLLLPWQGARLPATTPARGAILLGLLGVVAAVLAPLPAPREALALALGIVLLGCAIPLVRRGVGGQMQGLVCAGNGVALAASHLPGVPSLAGLLLAVLALEGVVLVATRPTAEAAP